MPNALKKPFVNRETFDPTNPLHMGSFEYFIQTGNWGDVQFFAELPYNEVPATVMMKYCEHTLKIKREAQSERSIRISKRPLLVVAPPVGTPSQEREKQLAAFAISNALIRDA